jgi:hypothetical protein
MSDDGKKRKGARVTAPASSGAQEFTRAIRYMLAREVFPRSVSSTEESMARLISSKRRLCSRLSASKTLTPVEMANATELVIMVVLTTSMLG